MRETNVTLKAFLRRFLVSDDEIDEVMQEAYMRMLSVSPDVSGDVPKPLLFSAARNLAISRLRHYGVIMRYSPTVALIQEESLEQKSAEERVHNHQQLQQVLAALNSLPLRCREVYVLRKIEGLSHKEIGERLDIAVSTVEKHLARGIRLINSYLAEQDRQDETPVVDEQEPDVRRANDRFR